MFISRHKSHYQNFEPPFEIPDSWKWVRLEDLCIFLSRGKSPKYSEEPNNYPVFAQKCNLKEGDISLRQARFLDPKTIGKWDENYHLREYDILINSTGTGTVGRTRLFRKSYLGNYAFTVPDSHVSVVRLVKFINPIYIFYVISSDIFQLYLENNLAGSTNQKELYIDVIGKMWIPLPGIIEQDFIAQKIKHSFDILINLDKHSSGLSSYIKTVKSKILELAMQGKLVPQDPTDEPAAEMLKRINPKAKIITDNPHSWNIPETWCWCQLGDLFNHNTGKALNSSNQDGQEYEYITTSNVYWDRFELDSLKKMFYKDSEVDKCKVVKGDLLVCEGGDVGRSAIWNMDFPIMIQNHLHRLRPVSEGILASLYIYLFRLYKEKELIGGKGIALQGFSSNTLHKLVVPCIPKNEQKRIVAMIEELYSVLDKIEASLQS